MPRKKISINFCGGCNSKINRKKIADTVHDQMVNRGHDVTYNRTDADFVVFLSGCSVSCAVRKAVVEAPCIVVAGPSIDSTAIEENSLVAEILARGRDHIE